jgi:hypothetical protein
MFTINLPAFFARLTPKRSLLRPEELSQDEIRELQRIRSVLTLDKEKQRLHILLHKRFTL